MSDAVLLGKIALSLVACALTVLLLRKRPFDGLSPRAFTLASVSVLSAARLLLYSLVFLVLRIEAQSDVLTYYDLAKHVLSGEVPYRDFFNGYAPLFPYLAAIPVRLWDSPKSIVLFSVLLEIASLPFWLAVSRRFFDEARTRTASVLYIFNPFLFVAVPLAGQNNVWLSFALAVSLYLLSSGRSVAAGLMFGAGVVAVKFLSLLHAPVLCIGSSRRVSFAIAFAALPALIYGYLFMNGISVLASLRYHATDSSSGNIPYLLTLFGLDIRDPALHRAYSLAGVAVIAAVFLIPLVRYRGFNHRQMIHMITILLFTLVLVSSKSYSPYLTIAYFAICLSVAAERLGPRALYGFLAFGMVVTLESSLWFRWLKQANLSVLWESPLPDGLSRLKILVFVAFELGLLGFYVHYLVRAFRCMGQAAAAGHGAAGAVLDRAGARRLQ
jgi:hypothetical protein